MRSGFIRMLEPDALQTDAGSHLQADETVRTQDLLPRAKGERPLSPDEQKSMLNILKQCGINDPGKFDAYFRGIRLVSSHDATCLRIGCTHTYVTTSFLSMKQLCQAYVTRRFLLRKQLCQADVIVFGTAGATNIPLQEQVQDSTPNRFRTEANGKRKHKRSLSSQRKLLFFIPKITNKNFSI